MTSTADLKCIACDRPANTFSGAGYPACFECAEKAKVSTLETVLDDVKAWLERFIVFPSRHAAVAVALWTAITHAADQLDVAPYLLITAPEIESGKTRIMEVAAPLCARPMFSSSMTPAVLFRTINRDHPTLFLDEADNTWTGRKDDKATELVALLNAGHRRGVKAQRMGGAGKTTLEEFDVFGPKAIAGAFPDIGAIPEALRSRSVHIRMKRKLPGEKVDRWTCQTRQESLESLERLRDRLAGLIAKEDISAIRVPVLADLSDRDFDIWEPLLAVATAAGGLWTLAAFDAAIALCAADASQAIPLRIQVLRDLQEVWEDVAVFMLTADLLDLLHKMDERPWNDYYGSPLTPHKLGRFLAGYEIESKYEPRREGQGANRRKGYYRQDLEDLWARYGGESSPSSPTSPEPPSQAHLESLETLESFTDVRIDGRDHPNPFEGNGRQP